MCTHNIISGIITWFYVYTKKIKNHLWNQQLIYNKCGKVKTLWISGGLESTWNWFLVLKNLSFWCFYVWMCQALKLQCDCILLFFWQAKKFINQSFKLSLLHTVHAWTTNGNTPPLNSSYIIVLHVFTNRKQTVTGQFNLCVTNNNYHPGKKSGGISAGSR